MKRTFRHERGTRSVPRDVHDEIEFHLAMRTREFMEQGMDAASAKRASLASFGDVAAIEAELRVARRDRDGERKRRERLRTALQQLRFAGRSLRRAPMFSITVIITLALGVGATTASFSVLNAVLLRALPYPDPQSLVSIGHAAPGAGLESIGQSRGSYFTYRKLASSFTEIGAYEPITASLSDPTGAVAPAQIATGHVTPSTMRALGVPPMLGRPFAEEDALPGSAPVAILMHQFWQQRFGGDRTVIGRKIQLDGNTVEVIGVMAESFRFPAPNIELLQVMRLNPTTTQGSGFGMVSVARLRPGITEAAAKADVDRAFARFPELYPTLDGSLATKNVIEGAKVHPTIEPLKAQVVGDIGDSLRIVVATAILVLLVATLNVSNLLLVRGDARQRELTIRAALGAGRGRVTGEFVSEAIVLAIAGLAAGLALAQGAITLLRRFGPEGLPRLSEIAVDTTSAAVAATIAVLAALVAAIIPAWRQSRVDLSRGLREGGRSGMMGRSGQRMRGALVAAQMAVALVLLGGSGLLVRSVVELRSVEPGFDANSVLTFRVSLPTTTYPKAAERARFHDRLQTDLLAIPGVRRVGAGTRIPLTFDGYNLNPVWAEEKGTEPGGLPPLANFSRASSNYFSTFSIPFLAGRTFDADPERQTPFEVVVNRKVANDVWGDSPGTSVVGKRMRVSGGAIYTVIGVVENTRDSSLTVPPSPAVFFPVTTTGETGQDDNIVGTFEMAVVMKVDGDPLSFVPAVRRAVQGIDATLPVFKVESMAALLTRSHAKLSFLLSMLGVAAGVTLALGAVGLYGVVAYVVSLRRQELGVRLALGATPRSVGRLVAGQGLRLGVMGAAVGLVLFAVSARLLRAMLYGVSPADPITLVAVTLVLVAMASLASWAPARRAARIDPVDAMRVE